MNYFKCIIFFITLKMYASEHKHSQITDRKIGINVESYNVHDHQMKRMFRLLTMYDIEFEKLNKNSNELRLNDHRLPTVFDQYISTKTRKDLPPDFRGIFKALYRLHSCMSCPLCKLRLQGCIESNQDRVNIVVQKNTAIENNNIEEEIL